MYQETLLDHSDRRFSLLQIPMVPIPRGDEFSMGQYGQGGYGQQGLDEQQPHEQGVPTMIVWSHPGNSVSVEGSWDNWTTR